MSLLPLADAVRRAPCAVLLSSSASPCRKAGLDPLTALTVSTEPLPSTSCLGPQLREPLDSPSAAASATHSHKSLLGGESKELALDLGSQTGERNPPAAKVLFCGLALALSMGEVCVQLALVSGGGDHLRPL